MARSYAFTAWSHPNITATHPSTFMFTKAVGLTKRGDCIVGIKADFEARKLKEIIVENEKFRMVITSEDGKKCELDGIFNGGYSDETELVIRTSTHKCPRTLGIISKKSSREIRKDLGSALKRQDSKLQVMIEKID